MATIWGQPQKTANAWGVSQPQAASNNAQAAPSPVEVAKGIVKTAKPGYIPEVKNFTSLKKVKVEGLTVLKILKHCQESLPESSSGTLLGLDSSQVLEVTNCFPHPINCTEKSAERHQLRWMEVLRDCYADNCCVGWYFCTNMGPFCTPELLEEQINYQIELDVENAARCALLIFDRAMSSRSHVSLRAYRVTQSYLASYQKQKATQPAAKSTSSLIGDMFEEVDVEISNPELIQLYLLQIAESEGLSTIKASNLSLSSGGFLERVVERLIEEGDRLEQEDGKNQYYDRQVSRQQQQQQQWIQQRKLENKAREERGQPPLPETDPSNPIFKPIQAPNKTEAALARAQLEVYCGSLNRYAAKAFPKLFISQGVQE